MRAIVLDGDCQLLRLVLLDRDGVINEDSPYYIKHPDEFLPIPGSIEAVARLAQSGLRVAICTNQSGLGRGLITAANLDAIHAKLERLLDAHGARLDGLFYCPHRPEDGCDCRKPAPGLVRQALAEFHVAPAQAVLIGDSLRDLEAARAAGCRAALVRSGNGRDNEAAARELGVTDIFDDLAAAADALLNQDQGA